MPTVRPFYRRLRFVVALVALIQVATLSIFFLTSRWTTGDFSEIVSSAPVRLSLQGNSVATLLGFYIASQFTTHTGLRTYIFTLPAMFASFGIDSLFNFALRLDYSRLILGIGFILSCFVFVSYFYTLQRNSKPHYAIIPGGNLRGLKDLKNATTVILKIPSLAGISVSALVADLREDFTPEWRKFIVDSTMAGIPVISARYANEIHSGRVDLAHLSENIFGTTLPPQSLVQLKHAADVIWAILVFPFVVSVIAIAALLIKLESPGAVFFRQQRIGYRGQPFTMLKLRSMNERADDGPFYTKSADPRVTRNGKHLRKFRIDELPQIWNIIKGEMSWIGPRPEVAALVAEYSQTVPFHAYRHTVRPGITGWAQVHQGNIGETEDEAVKISYDFYYIKNFSIWLDFLIVLKTIRTVLTGFGSV
jgi:lipopolysaccharide/colanic/teichoic acid biosynthesis glycosyltransferase